MVIQNLDPLRGRYQKFYPLFVRDLRILYELRKYIHQYIHQSQSVIARQKVNIGTFDILP